MHLLTPNDHHKQDVTQGHFGADYHWFSFSNASYHKRVENPIYPTLDP